MMQKSIDDSNSVTVFILQWMQLQIISIVNLNWVNCHTTYSIIVMFLKAAFWDTTFLLYEYVNNIENCVLYIPIRLYTIGVKSPNTVIN